MNQYFDKNKFQLSDLDMTDPNRAADAIEWYCWVSKEKKITISHIADRIQDEMFGEAKIPEFENDKTPSPFFIAPTENEPVSILPDDESFMPFSTMESLDFKLEERREKLSTKLLELFDFLRSRQEIFDNYYPFEIENDFISLKKGISYAERAYLLLIASSLLQYATAFGRDKMGHLFEELCEPIFKFLLPGVATIEPFGKGIKSADRFKGGLYQKVRKLADALHVKVKEEFTQENVGKYNTGDGGLDWVGWLDFKDGQSSIPVFFGQCACGDDWEDKQDDAAENKWNCYLDIQGYMLFHFIPRCFRKNNALWHNPLKIRKNVILIDRLRLLEILQSNQNLEAIIQNYTPVWSEIEAWNLEFFE